MSGGEVVGFAGVGIEVIKLRRLHPRTFRPPATSRAKGEFPLAIADGKFPVDTMVDDGGAGDFWLATEENGKKAKAIFTSGFW